MPPALETLAAEYEREGTVTALARRHGVSRTTVRRWLRTAGVTLEQSRFRRFRRLPEAGEIHWLLAHGETTGSIAARFGVSRDAVTLALRRAERRSEQQAA